MARLSPGTKSDKCMFVFPSREESIRIEEMLRRVLGESQIPREKKGSISHNVFTLTVTNNIGLPVGLVVKNPPTNAGDVGSIPGSGRSPGGGHGHPLQYSCLGNPMDRGAWRATVHGVSRRQHNWSTKQAHTKLITHRPTVNACRIVVVLVSCAQLFSIHVL